MAASIRKLIPCGVVLVAALALSACGGESEGEQLPPTMTPDPRISELQTAVTGHQGRLDAAESENLGQATAIAEGQASAEAAVAQSQASVEAVIAVDRAEAVARATEVAHAIGTAQADGAHSAAAYATISAATAIAQASAIAELDQSHSDNTSADQTAVAAIENNLDAQATAAAANATAIAAQSTEIAAMQTQTSQEASAQAASTDATAAALATADAELAASVDATAAALATADAELASRTDATIAAESAAAQATAEALATAQAEQAAALATADAEQAARFDATAAAEQAAREEGDAAQATALAEQGARFDATIAADQTKAAENVAAQETALAEQGARFDATIAADETAEATARAQIERTISALSTDVTPEVETGNPDSVPRTPTPSSGSVSEPDVAGSQSESYTASAESGAWRIEVVRSWIDTSLGGDGASAPVPFMVVEVTLTNTSGAALDLPVGALVLTASDGTEIGSDAAATLIAQQGVDTLPDAAGVVLQPGETATVRIAFSVKEPDTSLYLTWSIASLAADEGSQLGIGSAFAIPVPAPLATRPEDVS